MTEQQTVTCRSVCERLVTYLNNHPLTMFGDELLRDARLALGQPDDLREAHDAVAQRLVEVQRQLDAANKRAEDAESKLRELEAVTGKTIAQHGDILERRIDNVEFLAGWLLDRLVERGAS